MQRPEHKGGSCSCCFGVTMEAEAGMTIHSQRQRQYSQQPNVQPRVCEVFVCMGDARLLS